jgi:hypothetical protein
MIGGSSNDGVGSAAGPPRLSSRTTKGTHRGRDNMAPPSSSGKASHRRRNMDEGAGFSTIRHSRII